MKIFRSLIIASAALASGLSVTSQATTLVTTTHIGTLPPSNPYFYITSETPGDTVVNAAFGHTVTGYASFDDTYMFTLPLSGFGSGSVSTSFSSMSTFLQITDVNINGKDFTAAQASAGISDIPISAGILNSIEVFGTTSSSTVFGTYDGTATFTSAAVPEPTVWATFIMGFALIGLAMRKIGRPNLKFMS